MEWIIIVLSILSVESVLCSAILEFDEEPNVEFSSRLVSPKDEDNVPSVQSKLPSFPSLDHGGIYGSKDTKLPGLNENEDRKPNNPKLKFNVKSDSLLSNAKEPLGLNEDINIDEDLVNLKIDILNTTPYNSGNSSVNYAPITRYKDEDKYHTTPIYPTVDNAELLIPKFDEMFKEEESDLPSDKNFLGWIWNPFGSTTSTTTMPTSQMPKNCPKCQCGLINKPNRIVGGTETRILQYPWVAYLRYRGKFYCGASIISDSYLLTAAHCVDGFNIKQMKVHVSDHDRNTSSEVPSIVYDVLELIKHTGYSTSNYNNDIALIKINGKIKFEGLMRPVCLPDRGPTYAGRDGIVIGWGALEESGVVSPTLQEVVVPILTNAECRATKYPARKITESMMCAGYLEGGKDSCQGDSGGPLHVVDNSIHKVVGVVSWGEGCATPGYPGVYARVNRYVTWIEYNTRNSCHCLSSSKA